MVEERGYRAICVPNGKVVFWINDYEAGHPEFAYLAARIERSFAGAQKAVEALDREALRLQRPVTRALAGDLFREP